MRVYVGTYTGSGSRGIYLLRLDPEAGTLSTPEPVGEAANPSFLALGPSARFLYAVGETDDFAGGKTGAVSAFAVEPGSGRLTLINQQPSGGAGPCHLTIDGAGRNVLVANYVGGSVAVLPVGEDGRLGAPGQVVQHAEPGRISHVHSVNLDLSGRFAFVADLGLDKVFVYRFDPDAGRLAPNDPPWAELPHGVGPRHVAVSADGRFVWVVSEMGNIVTAFALGGGALRDIQTISTLPGDFVGTSCTAEIQAHPSGRFLYASNRGHDSVAAFAIDVHSGLLAFLGLTPTGGQWPRHFSVDPTGRFLLVANQRSDNLVLFRIDPASGSLAPTGVTARIPAPSCVRFTA